ncbi:hypothetical protein [Natronococcus pandeyae]|uniref:hypothetical protein n=1 Tax=Natronococcus pandeyae TaxID=2055836 RepID=UPI001652E991|nr:hypothetical protein [Natronococcus pandeyae]
MSPSSSLRSETQRQALLLRLETLATRLEAAETRQQQLERTVAGLARESGLSVGSPCTRCDRSNILMKSGFMYCPECGYKQSI